MNPDTLNPGDTLTLNGDTYIVESLERTTYIGKDDDTLETQTIKVTLTNTKEPPNNWLRALAHTSNHIKWHNPTRPTKASVTYPTKSIAKALEVKDNITARREHKATQPAGDGTA